MPNLNEQIFLAIQDTIQMNTESANASR